MSLNWNLTGIKDYEEVCFYTATEDDPRNGVTKGDRLLKPETNSLIWLTLITGVGWGITEQNIQEFVWRVKFYERLEGAMLHLDGKPMPYTEEQIRQHVGLSTNVSYEPRAEWLDRMFRGANNISGKAPEPDLMIEEDEDEYV